MTTRPDTWMPLFVADYLADTTKLTTTQHGAYLLLIMAYWRDGEPLADDDEELAAITKLPMADWRRMRPKLAVFFEVENGLWRHGRIDAELIRAAANIEQRSKAGRASAKMRADKRLQNSGGNGRTNDRTNGNGNETPNESGNGTSTDVPTDEVTGGSTKPPTKGQREGRPPPPPLENTNQPPSLDAARRRVLDVDGAERRRGLATEARAAADADPILAEAREILAAFNRAVREVWNLPTERIPDRRDLEDAKAWARDGITAELCLDVFGPLLVAKRDGGSDTEPPTLLRYCTKAVRRAFTDRGSRPQAPAASSDDPEREAAAQRYLDDLEAWKRDNAHGNAGRPEPKLADYLPPVPPALIDRRKASA